MKKIKCITLGGLIAISAISVGLTCVGSVDEKTYGNLNKNFDYSINKDDSTDSIWYYVDHFDEIESAIAKDYDLLAKEFTDSTWLGGWYDSASKINNKTEFVDELDNLDISFKLKLFILQNYFESKFVNSLKINNFEHGSPNQRMTTDELNHISANNDELHALQGTTNQKSYIADRYNLTSVTVTNEESWDIGEHKGQIDLISGRYFAELLATLPNKGWVNGDANASWTCRRVMFEFTDTLTRETDSFSLLYNTARDTNGNNEDYTFVAIEATDYSNITTDGYGNRVPSVFGVPVSFAEVQTFHYTNAHVDNAYIISGHEVDKGDDNNAGNALAGIPGAPVLNLLNATHSLNLIAKDLYDTVIEKLSFNPSRYNNKLNQNFINISYPIDMDDQNVEYLIKPDGTRLHVLGNNSFVNDIPYDYGDTVTRMHWTTQMVADSITTYLYYELKHITNVVWTAIRDYNNHTIYLDTMQRRIAVVQPAVNQLRINFPKYQYYQMSHDSFIYWWYSAVVNTNFTDSSSWYGRLFDRDLDIHSPVVANAILKNESLKTIYRNDIRNTSDLRVVADFIVSFTGRPEGMYNSLGNVWDHQFINGKGEWDFQWSNNIYVMTRLAEYYTFNYTNGMAWQVGDSPTAPVSIWIKNEYQHDSAFTWMPWEAREDGRYLILPDNIPK